jgi:DNA-binding response OmpR family regulator
MNASFDTPATQTVRLVKRLVHLVTTDSELASSLNYQISHFGYTIQVSPDLKSLEAAVMEQSPQAILVDMPSLKPYHQMKTWWLLFRIGVWQFLFFISDNVDQSTRLTAVRSGGGCVHTQA